MDIDSEGNCYLLETRRIIKLDSNLTPLKEIALPFGTVRFATINNNEIALVNLGREDEIHIISDEGKELTSYLQYSDIVRRGELKPFIKSGPNLLYKPICSDDIFKISPDSISLYTQINFEKPIPKNYWSNKKPTDFLDFSMYMGDIYIL
jgi:hypothetical protein